MPNFISAGHRHSKSSRLPFYWAFPLYAFVFLLLMAGAQYLSNSGFEWLVFVLWYFPTLVALIYLPVFLVSIIGSKMFKTGAFKEGDRVEITSGEHCGFTGRILQIYPGQNAIRVFIETISGTKIDVVFKREQLSKLRPKKKIQTLAD